MPELMIFNMFGMIEIKRTRITGVAASIEPNRQAIQVAVAEDFPEGVDGVKEGESHSFIVSAFLEPDNKARVGLLPVGEANFELTKTKEVKLIVRKLTHKIRRPPYFESKHPVED